MSTAGERASRSEQQRNRRMRQRSCRCGRPADLMLDWLGQSVPACRVCHQKLESAGLFEYVCALDEVPASLLRPVSQSSVEPGDVPQSADLQEEGEVADEKPRRSLLQNARAWIVGS